MSTWKSIERPRERLTIAEAGDGRRAVLPNGPSPFGAMRPAVMSDLLTDRAFR
jgi:hypothetical protein